MSRRAGLWMVVVACFLMAATRSFADKWTSPKPVTVISSSGVWWASMTPSPVIGKNAELVVARAPVTGDRGGYRRALVNRQAPLDLFVADNGAVVTLDDWHYAGHEHALVIYDRRGAVVVDQRLEDFLTKDELDQTRPSATGRPASKCSCAHRALDE